MSIGMNFQDQLEDYRRAKESDMDLIHARLKAVISSRDATIRQLRAELGGVQIQLSKLQGFMEQRSREMVAAGRSSCSSERGGSPGSPSHRITHSVLSVRPSSPAKAGVTQAVEALMGSPVRPAGYASNVSNIASNMMTMLPSCSSSPGRVASNVGVGKGC